jgi:hypothetical protein
MSTVQLFCTVFLFHVCSVLASEKESFSIQIDEKATTCGLDDFQIDTLAKYVHETRYKIMFVFKMLHSPLYQNNITGFIK